MTSLHWYDMVLNLRNLVRQSQLTLDHRDGDDVSRVILASRRGDPVRSAIYDQSPIHSIRQLDESFDVFIKTRTQTYIIIK